MQSNQIKEKNENIIENESTNKLNEIINKIKINLKKNINITYLDLIKNKQDIPIKDIEKWKDNILINMQKELDKLIDYNSAKKEEKINEKINKSGISIENNDELNMFTSKEIQEENKEITRNFQNEAYNYMNMNEKVENENVAIFLKKVAKISRIGYNEGNNIFNLMKKKYIKLKGNKISIDDEKSKKEFSVWIKNLEKENGKKEFQDILKHINLFEKNDNSREQKFFLKLFYDLAIMYFHCFISFPSIQLNFEKEENFNSDEMIDFINRGKNRKVNFIILPSLISNGIFLQNGKSWVFTFSKNTFRFEDLINQSLNGLLKKEYLILNLKENLIINVYCKTKNQQKNIITIKTNIKIPKNIENEFIFYYKDNNKNIYYKKKIKGNNFEINKIYKINKYEFKLENETIRTSNNIINDI